MRIRRERVTSKVFLIVLVIGFVLSLLGCGGEDHSKDCEPSGLLFRGPVATFGIVEFTLAEGCEYELWMSNVGDADSFVRAASGSAGRSGVSALVGGVAPVGGAFFIRVVGRNPGAMDDRVITGIFPL